MCKHCTLYVVCSTRIQLQDPETDKHWLITVSELFSRVAPQAASSEASTANVSDAAAYRS